MTSLSVVYMGDIPICDTLQALAACPHAMRVHFRSVSLPYKTTVLVIYDNDIIRNLTINRFQRFLGYS